MIVEGVDYSTDHPSPTGLYEVGKRFAVRYVGPGTSPKHLTADEARALAAAGLSIAVHAEGVRDGLLGGASVGRDWARRGYDHARRLGMPADRPVYLSIDFDMQAAQWPAVRSALRAAEDEIGAERVGTYGGYRTIALAAGESVGRYYHQTYAWSGGRWHPAAHLHQYRNGVSLVGGTVDLDRALVPDYGQWRPGEMPTIPGGSMTITDGDVKRIADGVLGRMYREYDPGEDAVRDPVTVSHTIYSTLDTALDTLRAVQALDPSDQGWAQTIEHAVREAVRAELSATPAIDAVAVAAAIGTNPDLLDAIARGVAARLATIEGSITLSGALAGGIRPPAVG